MGLSSLWGHPRIQQGLDVGVSARITTGPFPKTFKAPVPKLINDNEVNDF